MKHTRIYLPLAALAIAGLASCSQDEMQVTPSGNEVTVEFTAAMTANPLSRALVSDGLTATNLSYVVFEKNGEDYTPLLVKEDAATFENKTAHVAIALVKGKTYTIGFWADAADAPYTLTPDGNITVSYDNMQANDESRDAFFKAQEITVSNQTDVNVVLQRPLAQLNFGTTDYYEARTLGADVRATGINISGTLPNTLSLATGHTSGEADLNLTMALTAMPNFGLDKEGNAAPEACGTITVASKDYQYLAMTYVLPPVSQNSSNTTLDFAVLTTDKVASTADVQYPQVPVRSNYRTNILGALLTTTTQFEIVIDPMPENDINLPPTAWDGTRTAPVVNEEAKSVTVTSPAELAGLADLVNGGNTLEGYTITLTSPLDLNGQTWTPIGAGTRSGTGMSSDTQPFKGTFDGNGYTISGLRLEGFTGDEAAGLFGVTSGATVRNIVLDNVDVNVPACEGAACIAGLALDNSTFSGIQVKSGTIKAMRGVGAIVGRMVKTGTIENCTNDVAISATGTNAGGIVGAAYYSSTEGKMTITNCHNTGAINSTAGYVGGIAGLSAADIDGCSNSGVIVAKGASNGGIVGEQVNCGSVKNCTNTADVTVTGTSNDFGTGGIVGWMRYNQPVSQYPFKEVIEISGNTNEGAVSGPHSAGGIIGSAFYFANVRNNTNKAASIAAPSFAAGILGNAQFPGASEGNTSHPGMEGESHIYVTDNITYTPGNAISSSCADRIVWDNSHGSRLTQSGNEYRWNGEAASEPKPAGGNTFTVTYPDEFMGMISKLNTNADAYANKTIRLVADIDLGGMTIPAVAVSNRLTLDGNGKTLSNYRVENVGKTGLFADARSLTVKNLTIDGATSVATIENGNGYAGALIGMSYGTIRLENVVVRNSTITGINKTGGMIGFRAENKMIATGCSVENCIVSVADVEGESGQIGGFVGYLGTEKHAEGPDVFTDCSVKNTTINVYMGKAHRKYSQFAGVFQGTADPTDIANYEISFSGITLEGNTVNTLNELAATTAPKFGQLLGGLRDDSRRYATVVIDGQTTLVDTESDDYLHLPNN